MVEFFKSLADKFLDFFNIGRAISIIIPGVLVAFVLLMLLSLAVFSPGTESAKDPQKSASTAGNAPAVPAGAATAEKKDGAFKNRTGKPPVGSAAAPAKKPEAPPAAAQPVAKAPADPLKPLGKQIAGDFLRVTTHYWVVLMVSLVLGILLYETGNVIIALSSANSTTKLYRYQEGPNAAGGILSPSVNGTTGDEVGLIYFAPFLKADFTGKENFYNFLISEYYRFLEFSAVMPVALLAATWLAGVYYLVACHVTNATCHVGVVIVVMLIVLVKVIMFYRIIFNRVLEGYRKASEDLIRGVTDATNRGIK
jgi:hypothetical protein